jgi:hypothetical protein
MITLAECVRTLASDFEQRILSDHQDVRAALDRHHHASSRDYYVSNLAR